MLKISNIALVMIPVILTWIVVVERRLSKVEVNVKWIKKFLNSKKKGKLNV